MSAQQESMRSILVTAEHEIEVEPDEIILSITISEYYEEEFMPGKRYEDYKTRHPLADIEAQFDKGLKNAKIKEDQITVVDAGNNWRPWGKEALISKQYRISAPDFECAMKVQNELRFKGVQQFRIAELKHENQDQLELDVKTEALKKARAKAEVMAAALGEKVGRPITIVESRGNYSPIMYRETRMLAMDESMGGNSAHDTFGNAFKKLQIKQVVEVRFELVAS